MFGVSWIYCIYPHIVINASKYSAGAATSTCLFAVKCFSDHECYYQASSEPIVHSQSAESKLIGCNRDC